MWKKLFFDPSKRDPSKFRALVAKYAAWPLWKKCVALTGVAVGLAAPFHSFVVGRLTVGWPPLGLARTITLSEEPILFIAVLTTLEAILAWMFYVLVRMFFFPDSFGRDH